MRFWRIHHDEASHGLIDWDHGTEVEGITCSVNSGHRRAGKRITGLGVELTRPYLTDFMWWTVWDCVIQDHVLRLFRDEGFTGFDVKPVRVGAKIREAEPDPCDDQPGMTEDDAARMKLPTLWEVVVTGWAGMALPESGVRLKKECKGCGHLVYDGASDPDKLINCSQWDGSDFFIVWPYPLFRFVTDRVAEFIRRREITGVGLIAPEDLDLSGGATPGRLSHWMPEARARELGEPLGIY